MTTLKVEILGTGCKKCQQLEANTKAAIATRNLEADVAHITDTMKIRQFKSEVHQRLIYLNRILQMVFYSQATFSVYC